MVISRGGAGRGPASLSVFVSKIPHGIESEPLQ